MTLYCIEIVEEVYTLVWEPVPNTTVAFEGPFEYVVIAYMEKQLVYALHSQLPLAKTIDMLNAVFKSLNIPENDIAVFIQAFKDKYIGCKNK